MLYQLKDIAAEWDCHPRTARRWIARLRVPPDVRGHGPLRWREKTWQRLNRLYELAFQLRGTTPQLTREKFAGKLTDEKQLSLFDYHATKTIPQKNSPQTTVKKARPRRLAAAQ